MARVASSSVAECVMEARRGVRACAHSTTVPRGLLYTTCASSPAAPRRTSTAEACVICAPLRLRGTAVAPIRPFAMPSVRHQGGAIERCRRTDSPATSTSPPPDVPGLTTAASHTPRVRGMRCNAVHPSCQTPICRHPVPDSKGRSTPGMPALGSSQAPGRVQSVPALRTAGRLHATVPIGPARLSCSWQEQPHRSLHLTP